MDIKEIISKIDIFLRGYCSTELREQIRKGHNFLIIDFAKLAEYDPDVATLLLEDPSDVLTAFIIVAKDFISSMGREQQNELVFRFKNLPRSSVVPIREIRTKHIDTLIVIEGVVRQKSDVRPKTVSTRFECPACGNIILMLQLDTKFKEPTSCGCGRKSKFKLISKAQEDVQWMTIEETLESISGDRAKKIKVVLSNDLVSPLSDKKTHPGSKLRLSGVLKTIPIELRDGSISTSSDLIIESNYFESIEETFDELNITEEDKKKILSASKNGVFNLMKDAILPSIHGYEDTKEALVLQLFGGVRKLREDDSPLRGDIHILLAGDPGSGKSAILKRICALSPKSRYQVMTSSSGVGLTGTVVKDDYTKGYALEAGALSLANKGLCAIDELDKSGPDETNKLHEAMEQQTISISKASIQETLPAETTILAASNPKTGRFDAFEVNAISQITGKDGIPITLLNRFDLIYIIKDIPNRDRDRLRARFILNKHKAAQIKEKKTGTNPFEDTKFFQKYVAYAKLNYFPELTDAACSYIEDYFTNLRSNEIDGSQRFSSIPISNRQLEALIRLSEASARLRLSKKVELSDAEFAVKISEECMKRIATDAETGKLDMGILSSGVSASTKTKIALIKDMIAQLQASQNGYAPYQDIVEAVKDSIDVTKFEELIDKLCLAGDVIEPKRGFFQLVTI